MTRIFGTIMALATTAVLGSCSQGGGFSIQVKSSDCNNMTIKLIRETEQGLEVVDSAKIEMHRARLRGSVRCPEMMYIFVDKASDYLPIFVENSQITVSLNYQKLGKSVVSGSESNKIFTDFIQSYSAYGDKASEHQKMSQHANVLGDTLMIQDLEDDINNVMQESKDFQLQFVRKHIKHPIACYILATSLINELSYSEALGILDSIPEQNRSLVHFARLHNIMKQKKNDQRP
ncbi:MAG: DUF4369 domain-containing protein [Bacteroidales bacterium]|nr:DUF4369 domain-containing protein [Bacteroidales bacterium]